MTAARNPLFALLRRAVRSDEDVIDRRAFLDAAYLGECGLETNQQSAITFISLVGTALHGTALHGGQFSVIGESDERYKIAGGNERIPKQLAALQADRIQLGHELVALKGAEGEPVGRLHFAGEHCAFDNQGFMEGALETGELAAMAIAKALRRAGQLVSSLV